MLMKAVDNSVLLRVENISKQFPGTLALDNVSLDIKRGEVHVLFGENGAGKSTLIQIIAGVHRPTKGKDLFKWTGSRATERASST